MKKITLLLAALITAAGSFAQSTEMRSLPEFTGIDIRSTSKINLRQDSMQSVKVTTEGSLDKVETRVEGNMLYVEGKGSSVMDISMKDIRKLVISGRGEIIGNNTVKSDNLQLEVSGDGKLDLGIATNYLKAGISGLGKMTLNGTADNSDFEISGSGKVDAIDLKTRNCKVDISGLGKLNIDVTDNLQSHISGSGSIKYKNEPKNRKDDITGLGKVTGYDNTISNPDTTKLHFGKSEVLIIDNEGIKISSKKGPRPIWQGFEMGINQYLNADGKFQAPAGYEFLELRDEKSVSVGLNLIQKNMQLGHSNVWFFTGLGLAWNNWYFEHSNVTLHPTKPITATYDTSSIYHIKSKLTSSYLVVPFMFEAFTSRIKKNALHIGAGAITGVRLETHTKQKSENNGNTFKQKQFDEFGLQPFRFGARAAIGFSWLNVFADYYFTPLFKNGYGPKLYPVNFGITLIGF